MVYDLKEQMGEDSENPSICLLTYTSLGPILVYCDLIDLIGVGDFYEYTTLEKTGLSKMLRNYSAK